ncbi:MAG: type II 3-dehydroquinate dehydratase, partial [Bacteroidota bacterium]
MKIIIINGPNLNLLGKRETHIYGEQTFEDFFAELQERFPKVTLEYFQSNHEGAILDKLHA